MRDLPKGWEWTTIGEICAKPQYGWTSKSSMDAAGLPYLRTTDISRGATNWSAVPRCLEDPPDLGKFLLMDKDIVVSRAGSVGISALLRRPPNAVFASYLIRLRCVGEIIPEYLAAFLQSSSYWRQISDAKVGIAVQNVNASKLAEIRLPAPPRAEQERIVATIEEHLSRLDAAGASLRLALARLDVVGASVISEVLGRFKWPTVCWGEVGETLSGRAFPSGQYGESGIRLLRPGNLSKSGEVKWAAKATTHLPVNFASDFPKYLLTGRHLVMNLTAQSLADDFLGRVCMSGADDQFLLNQRIARLSSPAATDAYLFWVFRSVAFRRFVASLNTGSLIQHISTNQLRSFEFPLPPIAEQTSIVEEIEAAVQSVDRTRDAVIASGHRSAALRRSILAAAFSGQLVPQDPDDEPASVLLERIRAERAAAPPVRKRRAG